MNKTIERRLKRIYNEFNAQGRVTERAFEIFSKEQHFYICGYYSSEAELMKILYNIRRDWRAHYALVS